MTQSSTGKSPAKTTSIFHKITGFMAIGVLVVAGTLAYLSAQMTRTVALDGLQDLALEVTNVIAGQSGGALRFGKSDELASRANELRDNFPDRLVYAGFFNTEGSVAFEQGALAGQTSDLTRAVLDTGTIQTSPDGLTIAVPARFGDSGAIAGVVMLAWSADVLMADVFRREMTSYLVAAVVGLFALGIVTFLLRRGIGRRLEAVSLSTETIAAGDLDTSVAPHPTADEVGRMAANLESLRLQLAANKDGELQRAAAAEEQSAVVEQLSVSLKSLAEGNLTRTIERPFAEDYEGLRSAFNDTVLTLRSMMEQIAENARQIHAGAAEIAASSDDLSRRTENQAATLVESAAALEELTGSVKAVSDRSQQVRDAMQTTRGEAGSSVEVVQNAVTAMGEIKQSSGQISQIISVIDDIAFQTNLLALNAGVEAARAGDAGRGFAVVASEVRALAQRSSDAAKEIETLIKGSAAHVERGVDLVGQTGKALQAISDQVADITELVIANAAAAEEQASGLSEINIGVTELDSVTQQNAAMVEEATAASHELRNEADKLSELLTRFDTVGRGSDKRAA